MTLRPLRCRGKDGVDRDFFFSVERDQIQPEDIVHVRVHDRDPPLMDRWFELRLERHAEGWRIAWIGTQPGYGSMGIPDSLLPDVVRELGVPIVSSSNKHRADRDEYRTVDAEKMWQRLLEKGIATYDETDDRYRCSGEIQPSDSRRTV